MKILFVTDLYPIKKGEKTTPLTLHNFVVEWAKLGHEVEVIKPNFVFNSFVRNKPFYFDGIYHFDGIKVLNLNYQTPFLFDVESKIKKRLDISSYDVIVAHMPSGIIFADKLSKKYNKPLICAVHNSDLEVLTKPQYSFYFKQKLEEAFKNSKAIACRSFVLEKKFTQILPECSTKTFVAPSGVDKNLINENPIEIGTSKLKVLTCANLIKRKNVDKLIKAIKKVEGFELNVIGDGKELRKLKRIGKGFKFSGRLPKEKVEEEMRKSDVFALPSVNETFGMVYLEAMASGCVTVCSKNDGVDGIIIDEKNGFLTEPTVEGIKETLLKIRQWQKSGAEKARFFGAPTLEKIRENGIETAKKYSPELCAKNYLDNIQKAL